MNATVSTSPTVTAFPIASSQQPPLHPPVPQPVDQFNRSSPIQSSLNQNLSLKNKGKLWTGLLPLTGVAAIFTDWRTVLSRIKLANPVKVLKNIGTAIKEMAVAVLKFFGKAFAHSLEIGFYAPEFWGYLLEGGFHMLKALADIPFAVFG